MTLQLILKASLIWLGMMFLAIANGLFREHALAHLFDADLALPLSGLTLSFLILLVTYLAFPLLGIQSAGIYFAIGLQWISMTLAFEFLFGHYVVGKPWGEILQVFNLARGDLFLVALLASLFAPWLIARVKDIL